MSSMRKERKSEYEKWLTFLPVGGPEPVSISLEAIELEKLRQLEQMKWLLDDLVDELRHLRKERSDRRLRGRVE